MGQMLAVLGQAPKRLQPAVGQGRGHCPGVMVLSSGSWWWHLGSHGFSGFSASENKIHKAGREKRGFILLH